MKNDTKVPTFVFEHVHIACRDLVAMENFFVDILGANLVAKRETNGLENVEILLGTGLIFLRRIGGSEAANTTSSDIAKIDHIGLQVTDIADAISHLRTSGFKILEGPVDWRDDLAFAYVEGPEGIVFELLDRRNRKERRSM